MSRRWAKDRVVSHRRFATKPHRLISTLGLGATLALLSLFALMDRVGLDVVRDIAKVYFEESGDLSDACPEILLDRIARGDLGVKRGKGFYTYPDPAWKSSSFLKSASP